MHATIFPNHQTETFAVGCHDHYPERPDVVVLEIGDNNNGSVSIHCRSIESLERLAEQIMAEARRVINARNAEAVCVGPEPDHFA